MPNNLPRNWEGKEVDKPLVEDLATVLAQTVVGWENLLGVDLAEAPEVKRVMARYREWKETEESYGLNDHE